MQSPKLKLIYIVTQADWGGAQRYIFDLTSALKDKFDITMAVGVGGSQELLQKCQEAGLRTHTFKNLVREINPLKDLAAVRELAKFFKKEVPDIIHLNSSKAGVIGALAARRFQISDFRFQIVYTAHGWVFNEPLPWWRKKLYMQMERTACKTHNKVIVLSRADFDVAAKNKICPPEKMVIIPHGIELINFLPGDEARKKLTNLKSLPRTVPKALVRGEILNLKSKIWIGTIANLYKTKGHEYLIDAAALLKKENLEPNFVIMGDGPERRNYELRIKNYELDNFYLIGSLNEAANHLKAFDIFILPSIKEGMPYALLEAMQAGLPIIATSVGAIPEMIENEKSGLVVKPKDSKMIREAIKKLLNDEGLRDKLGREAQKTFQEKFDFQKMIEVTIKTYAG